MVVKFDRTSQRFLYTRCDGSNQCFDGHSKMLEFSTASLLAP